MTISPPICFSPEAAQLVRQVIAERRATAKELRVILPSKDQDGPAKLAASIARSLEDDARIMEALLLAETICPPIKNARP